MPNLQKMSGDTLPQHPETKRLSARESRVITILLVSSFVVILNETLMSVALPRLMADFNVSATTAQWLTTAFLLTMAIVIPVTGMLMTRFSTRSLYMLAMVLFISGTVLGALAPSFSALVAARVIQATGTAIMLPLLMTTVITVVPAEIRGRIMGRITIVIAVAPALGPTISGLILSFLSWQWLFILMLPIAVSVASIGAVKVQNMTATRFVKIDILSIALSVIGFGGFVYGMNAVAEAATGVQRIHPAVPLVLGVGALIAFVLRQKHLELRNDALLDLRTFQTRTFSLALVLIMMSMLSLFGALFIIPIYAIEVLGLSVLQIGLVLLPGGILLGVLGPVVGRIFDRWGPQAPLTVGTALTAISFWGMRGLQVDTNVLQLVFFYVLLCVGLACLFTPLFAVGLGSLPKNLYAYGSATFSTGQQLAGAAGTTAFSLVLAVVSTSALAEGINAADALAEGSRAAFTLGAIVASAAFAVSWFVRDNTRTQRDERSTP